MNRRHFFALTPLALMQGAWESDVQAEVNRLRGEEQAMREIAQRMLWYREQPEGPLRHDRLCPYAEQPMPEGLTYCECGLAQLQTWFLGKGGA